MGMRESRLVSPMARAALALSASALFMPTEGLTRSVARRRLTAAIKPKKQRPFKGSKTAKRTTKRGGNQGKSHD